VYISLFAVNFTCLVKIVRPILYIVGMHKPTDDVAISVTAVSVLLLLTVTNTVSTKCQCCVDISLQGLCSCSVPGGILSDDVRSDTRRIMLSWRAAFHRRVGLKGHTNRHTDSPGSVI